MKKLKLLLGVVLTGLLLLSGNAFSKSGIRHVTIIDGVKYDLDIPSPYWVEKKRLLTKLEKAMAESNRITEAYLKTNSPAWKDLNTEEFKANSKIFSDVWYQIVVERHYNKDVLDAYEKFKSMELKNRQKMYEHFFKLSSNEPFKEKVKTAMDNNLAIFKDNLNVIKHLRTYL